MAVTVKITETYDMKTTVNRMGLVGVHTPQVSLLRRLYPGLLKNHRFFRFVRCDVTGACASVLPADPLQVGVSAGKVAPEDMFNPILYTAVTNTAFDTIVARIRALNDVNTLASVEAGNAITSGQSAEANFNVYYGLLAENGKWKKVMPQSGFLIKGLVPLAHTLVSTFGNVGPNMGDAVAGTPSQSERVSIPVPDMDIPVVDEYWNTDADGSKSVYFRGKTVKMPKFPCHVSQETWDSVPNPSCPSTQVLAMILPPAKLNEFYYRMRVTWTVRFENVISTNEVANYGTMIGNGENSYGSNYTYSSSKEALPVSEEMIDGENVEITKVMES